MLIFGTSIVDEKINMCNPIRLRELRTAYIKTLA